LPVSTSEWIHSDIIAELPVIEAAANLVTDIRALPINAAIMTNFEPDAMLISSPGQTATIAHREALV
jgi:hypothetical protein